MARTRIALLSNPKSTGNLAQLPRIRAFCAGHPDIFHYEVEKADQVGTALETIARVRPKMLVINGGDGTVQAALTELYNGGHFGTELPPVAVLPSGKTNLIAFDLGSQGDPIVALEKLMEIAQADLSPHIVARELIALRCGAGEQRPVIGMFLGGAGLADTMLYCREKIYPLGLPNGISHAITGLALFAQLLLRLKASFLPPNPSPVALSWRNSQGLSGRFSLLAVTTLDKVLMSSEMAGRKRGALRLLAIEQRPGSMVRALFATIAGKLSHSKMRGVHFEESDEISIEGESSNVILDGETFRAEIGRPIFLKLAQPLSFVRIAA
ncbi:MAG: diacylglycerol kinase family protein [Sphingomicrobium sp.]